MTRVWYHRGNLLASVALLATMLKHTDASRVGQEVCVSGFITCIDCNIGSMAPYNTAYNMFQAIVHPEEHNMQCLLDNESCRSDGYEVVTNYFFESAENRDVESNVFCRSFKLDSNSSNFIADAGLEYYTFATSVQVGGIPVSFAGQITDVGDASSLATVALDTSTLSLSEGGRANENIPQHCISQSGSFQYSSSPIFSSTKAPSISPVAPVTMNPVLPTTSHEDFLSFFSPVVAATSSTAAAGTGGTTATTQATAAVSSVTSTSATAGTSTSATNNAATGTSTSTTATNNGISVTEATNTNQIVPTFFPSSSTMPTNEGDGTSSWLRLTAPMMKSVG